MSLTFCLRPGFALIDEAAGLWGLENLSVEHERHEWAKKADKRDVQPGLNLSTNRNVQLRVACCQSRDAWHGGEEGLLQPK